MARAWAPAAVAAGQWRVSAHAAYLGALVAITLLGAALRLYRLGAADLWLDEANTALVAAQPLAGMLRTLTTDDVHPPLFYLLVHPSLAASWSAIGLRAVPWLCGVLIIPLAAVIARQLAGRAAGLAAAALTAASAPLVLFAQEGRMYSLLALLETLATWCLVRALESGERRWWLGFGAVSTLALYTHNFAGLFLLAHLLAALLARRGLRPALLTVGGVAVLYAPWAPSALAQVLGTSGGGNAWLGDPAPLWLPLVTLVNLLLGAELRDGLLSPRFAAAHLYLLAPALTLLAFGWRRLGVRPLARLVFTLTLLAPPLLALAASQRTNLYVDKPFLAGAVLLPVVMAAGLPRVDGRVACWAALLPPALLVGAQVWALGVSWAAPREQYTALVSDYLAQRRAGDHLVALPAFMSRPVAFVLRAEGQPTAIGAVDIQAADEAFRGRPGRVWLVSGGIWISSSRADHSATLPAPPGYRIARQRFYPDAALALTLYERAP